MINSDECPPLNSCRCKQRFRRFGDLEKSVIGLFYVYLPEVIVLQVLPKCVDFDP